MDLTGSERGPDRMVIDVAIRLCFLGILAYWSLKIVLPFALIVVWAVILVVAIYPIHNWVSARLGSRARTTSMLITLIGLLIILGPIVWLMASLIDSLKWLGTQISEGELSIPPVRESIRDWPVIGEDLYEAWVQASTNLSTLLAGYQGEIVSIGKSMLGTVAGLGGSVLSFAVSVVIAGFLYGGGPSLADGARRFAERLSAGHGGAFIDLAGATIRNISRGVIGISLAQALLAGIGLIVAKVPVAGLIALGVLVLGMIQVGPTILLLPVIIWAWTTMDTISAVIFTAYMLPVALLDNVLKPIVMAQGLRTPMLVIFVGVIGGTLAHGLIGLFLGPIVLAVFYELLVAWVNDRQAVQEPADSAELAP